MAYIKLKAAAFVAIPGLWVIPFLEAIHYLKNIKKYGIRNTGVIASILYLGLTPLVYYDFIFYSKLSGNLILIMSNHPLAMLYRSTLIGSALYLIIDFGSTAYNAYKKHRLSTTPTKEKVE